MNDNDYHVALLLQKQLQEEKLNTSNSSDFHMALVLQEQFNHEINTEQPSNNLVYDTKKKSKEDSRSLVDPSWELVDPTPNIHNLFIAFNERFFWNKLLAVCVSWSKRMTSCAGICSYQGRGGLCSITLSEPLLKLRPRKDLIETLLHEMIHAYLFVTDNNKDRDGHGPEFHKHMFRINKESGTNITVYHTFHDEVRLYQQHWWRCNGPCHNQKPYFGMVRRATNRAPGPNDRWWGEHSRLCGGTFIKVKEPEKVEKKQKEVKQSTKSSSDIRNYITSVHKDKNSNKIDDSVGVHKTISSNKENINKMYDVSGLKDRIQSSPKTGTVFTNANVHGFVNLDKPHMSNNNKQTGNNINVPGTSTRLKSNSNKTVVITKKPSTTSKTEGETIDDKMPKAFSGTGHTLSGNGIVKVDLDYTVIRNHWLNKFENDNKKTSNNKRTLSSESVLDDKLKRPKLNEQVSVDSNGIYFGDDSLTCPVCLKKFKGAILNEHLDKCLESQTDSDRKDEHEHCFICSKTIDKSQLKRHVAQCVNNAFNSTELTQCEICNVYFDKNEIESHTSACVSNMFNSASQKSQKSTSSSNNELIIKLSQCSVCDEMVDSDIIDKHVEACVHKMFDDIERKCNLPSTDERVSCLVCNKQVPKSELNIHLDECMSGVFDGKNDFNECDVKTSKVDTDMERKQKKTEKANNNDNKQYNCPFCLEMYSELDMSGHIDICIATEVQINEDTSILMDSLSSDDF